MKFKGKMTDQTALSAFAKIIGPVSRMTKQVVIVVAQDTFSFIINKHTTTQLCRTDASVHIEMRSQIFFEEYDVTGIRPHEGAKGDRIMFIIDPKQVDRTIHRDLTRGRARTMSFSLLQRGDRYFLSIEICVPSASSALRLIPINHEFAIHLVAYRDYALFQLPTPRAQSKHATVEIENFPLFRAMIDNLKRMGGLVDFFIINLRLEDNVRTILKVRCTRGACMRTQIDFNIRPLDLSNMGEADDDGNSNLTVKANVLKLTPIWSGLKFNKVKGKLDLHNENMLRFSILMDDVRVGMVLPHKIQEVL